MKKSKTKDPNRYPKGWDRNAVEDVIRHYENQSDEDAIAEAEAAYKSTETTMMAIPVKLVSKVQQLIAKQAG